MKWCVTNGGTEAARSGKRARGSGRGWLACLLVMCWSLGQVPAQAAKPVSQVWRELKRFKLAVVTNVSEDVRQDLRTKLFNGLPTRWLSPIDAVTDKCQGEQILWLIDRSTIIEWPPELFERLPFKIDELSANRAVAEAWNQRSKGDDGWEVVVTAPDNASLLEALELFLKSDAANFNNRTRSELLSYRLENAVLIGADPGTRQWVTAQQTPVRRFRVKELKPTEVNQANVESATLLVMRLTHASWHALPEEGRAQLEPFLTEPMREALDAEKPTPQVFSGLRSVGERLVAVRIGPAERFLASPAGGDDKSELANLAWPSLSETKEATFAAKDLRALPRLLLVNSPAASPQQAAWLHDLADAASGVLANELGFSIFSSEAIEQSVQLDNLMRALSQGDTSVQTPDQFDAVAIVRLTSLTGERSQHLGDAQCATRQPDGPGSEPSKPNPQEKPLFSGHSYAPHHPGGTPWPGGPIDARANDPKYLRAVRDYQDNLEAYRRKKREYEATLVNMDCLWRQVRETRKTVHLRGQLQIVKDGAVILQRDLVGTGGTSSKETLDLTVRGWGRRPTSPEVEPTRQEITPELVGQAIREAVSTVQGISVVALVPKDAGQSGSFSPTKRPDVQIAAATTSGGGAPQAAALAAGADGSAGVLATCEVTGVGDLTDGEEAATQRATLEAQRLAVEQVVGTYLQSTTVVDQFQLLQDTIRAQSAAWARVLEVRKREVRPDGLYLTCLVEVQNKPIRQQLAAMQLLRRWRVMVVVPELFGNQESSQASAETALIGQFVQAGFPVVDAAHSATLRQNRELLAQLRGSSPEAMALLRQQYGAEILITGEAKAEPLQVTGLAEANICRADLVVRAVDLNTAEVLGTGSANRSGRESSMDLASRVACRAAAEAVADPLVEAILTRPLPAQNNARVELQVTGFDSYAPYGTFLAALKALPGVSQVVSTGFQVETTTRLEVHLAQQEQDQFPMRLETEESLLPFHVKVISVNVSTVVCKVETRQAAEPETRSAQAAAGETAEAGTSAAEPDGEPAAAATATAEPAADAEAAAAAEPAEVEITLNEQAISVHGQGLIPAKQVLDWIGIEWDWDRQAKVISGTWVVNGERREFRLPVDAPGASINGEPVTMASPATIRGGRTWLPAAFIAALTDGTVDWDGATRTITVTVGHQAARFTLGAAH